MSRPPALPDALIAATRVSAMFRRAFAAEMAREDWAAEAGAGPGAYAVLRALTYRPASSQREIAELVFIDPSDLVGILNRMEQAGWIERTRSLRDKRRVVVSATPAGDEAFLRYHAVAARVAEHMLAGLSDEDQETFARLSMRVAAAAESSDVAVAAGRAPAAAARD
jgi:DNA-binding MarR family transcriptional regulator